MAPSSLVHVQVAFSLWSAWPLVFYSRLFPFPLLSRV
jgi:hypothetical protein